ncbi:MAG: hypothetical protein KAG61_04240 [Bacteriovoracaceae bacterium]|nr:hypothetical protein [Bacteriovoracaceae bacterium]
MRWMLLACTNFLVAIMLVSFFIVGQTQSKFSISENVLQQVKLEVNPTEFSNSFGAPHLKFRNKWIYKGEQRSTLTVQWKNDKAVQVDLSFPSFVDFKDVSHVDGNGLTALDTPRELVLSGWMKVGLPHKGIVFQINRDGHVKRMTWHRPWEAKKSGGDILAILSLLRDLPPYAYNN